MGILCWPAGMLAAGALAKMAGGGWAATPPCLSQVCECHLTQNMQSWWGGLNLICMRAALYSPRAGFWCDMQTAQWLWPGGHHTARRLVPARRAPGSEHRRQLCVWHPAQGILYTAFAPDSRLVGQPDRWQPQQHRRLARTLRPGPAVAE